MSPPSTQLPPIANSSAQRVGRREQQANNSHTRNHKRCPRDPNTLVHMADDPDDPSNNSTQLWASSCPQFVEEENVTGLYCNASFDGVSCWPPTKAGSLVIIPCFAEFRHIKYDVNDNASRVCHFDGTWEKNSNYSNCKPLLEHHKYHLDTSDVNRWTVVIYFTGYSLSLAALVVALTIFLLFKDLRCLRNTFHANLLLTYILVNITWICIPLVPYIFANSQSATCVLIILLYYFLGTNFFWMFVEGFYLYLLVIKTFQVEKVKFFVYLLIGWGLPMLVVAIWAIVKAQLVGKPHLSQLILGQTATGCPWIQHHFSDYIYFIPILLVLSINILFLIQIMWVLITKLRISTSAESQQYRKAAKALLVLIPLLGVTYILFVTSPDPTSDLPAAIFTYVRAFFFSTQGFTVSVLYCFLNGEVRNSISRHWRQWRQRRSVNSKRKSTSSGTEHGKALLSDEGACLRMIDKASSPETCETSVSCLTTAGHLGNGYSKAQQNDTCLVTDTYV